MMKWMWGILCGAALFGAWSGAEARKPNVIMIFTDDHGYADLGVQGVFDDVKTPNIDALAAAGARMTDGYSTAPQCGPSRAGLISGRYQNKFGMEANGDFEKQAGVYEAFLACRPIPRRMKEAGYATGMAGKSHLGSNECEGLMKLGFEKVFLKNSNAPGRWNMDMTGKDINPRAQNGGYHIDQISDFTRAFITRFKDQPFFFYLAYRAPHVPLDAPKKYLDRFPGDMPERRRQALAMLSAVDDGVGRVMETLRENGLEEDTLVFLVGDNGAPLKIHKLDAPGGGPGWDGSLNDPMNGEKGMLTEGGLRVPFVVSWKGTIPGGQVYSEPVIALDMAATANAVAGLPEDPALDGVNLVPYLTGVKQGAPHEKLYWRWLSQSAIRAGKWKYLRCDEREYLFDMENDFEETNNLFSSNPEVASTLRADLEKWANTLTPPGVGARTSAGMSKVGNTYFDWYLDGKRDEAPPAPRGAPARKKGPSDEKIFAGRDADQSGDVTWDEFLKGRTNHVDQIKKSFERRDTDGDGVWEKAEIK